MTHILSADIGGTTCKLGIFDRSLNIEEKWEISTNKTGEGILENIYDSFVVHLNRKDIDIKTLSVWELVYLDQLTLKMVSSMVL